MTSSYDHRITVLPADRQTCFCSASRHCQAPIVFYASYRYTTGRQGRTTRRDLYYCEPHGEKFAAKHKIEIERPTPSAAGRILGRIPCPACNMQPCQCEKPAA
jgi:hypothetical protein